MKPSKLVVALWFGILGIISTHTHAFGITTMGPKLQQLSSQRTRMVLASPRRTATVTAAAAAVDFPVIESCDVVIMGGGFGGLYTALALARQARRWRNSLATVAPLKIVLIEPTDRFVFLPLLYDLTMGTATEWEVCPTYEEILAGTGIRHVQGQFLNFATSTNSSNSVASKAIVRMSPQTGSAFSTSFEGSVNHHAIVEFRHAVIAVGASPETFLSQVPGARDFAQPFYTRDDAYATRSLLNRIERRSPQRDQEMNTHDENQSPRIAVVGGGYGGVELAACIQRQIPRAKVVLHARNPPLRGTKAEPLVNIALGRLGIEVRLCSVQSITLDTLSTSRNEKYRMITTGTVDESATAESAMGISMEDTSPFDEDTEVWDAILWTAGSSPAYPVSDKIEGLEQTSTNRLATDSFLRCIWHNTTTAAAAIPPSIWALGDCAEVRRGTGTDGDPMIPKTAQAAMQQAEVVAQNVLAEIVAKHQKQSTLSIPKPIPFQYQDLGSMFTLGGPNAAVIAPRENSTLSPLVTPLLDTARTGLLLADHFVLRLGTLSSSSSLPILEKMTGIRPSVSQIEELKLSLGGYGLGVMMNDKSRNGCSATAGATTTTTTSNTGNAPPGTLAGTVAGAARRIVYAARMPTPRQQAQAAFSAFLATTVSVAREITTVATKSSGGSGSNITASSSSETTKATTTTTNQG